MSDPLKSNRLPQRIDVRRLAAKGVELSGGVPTADMARLRDSVLDAAEEAAVALKVRQDEERRTLVEGDFRLQVELRCQRCLQGYALTLEGHLCVGAVWTEGQAADLPRWLDPWLVESDSADLYSLVEDELLLALPIVAYHPGDECPESGSYSTGESEEERRENPFSVLEHLKRH